MPEPGCLAPQVALRHTSREDQPRCLAPQVALRHTSPEDQPRCLAPQVALRHTSPQDQPRCLAPQVAVRHTSAQDQPRCLAPQVAVRDTSARDQPRCLAPQFTGLRAAQCETAAAASSETRVSVWNRSSANGAITAGVLRRDQLGERRADDRRGLEAVGAPAGGDVEVLELGLAEDRAVVGREVAEAGPGAQHLDALELREELEHVAGRVLEERERPDRLVGRVRLDLGADQELAAVGLRDVDVHLRGDDDHVEERLGRLGHERLQDVRGDRQPHAGEAADERRPARDGADHDAGLDPAAVRLHAR